jgi:hypothetical protein
VTVTQRTAQSLTEFMDDPINFFGQSYTQMHSIDRDELESLQRQAMASRFQQHYQSIEMLRKLADRLGTTAVEEFNDVVPLFFSHTAFKSYPAALIDKKRFDLMTKWLDKLTSYDLSAVDTSDCTGIDEWIERLDAQTPLEVITSSGTTGTISIPPKMAWCCGRSACSRLSGTSPPMNNSTRRSMWCGRTSPTASWAICASPT